VGKPIRQNAGYLRVLSLSYKIRPF
jgi:hypothetical protein